MIILTSAVGIVWELTFLLFLVKKIQLLKFLSMEIVNRGQKLLLF